MFAHLNSSPPNPAWSVDPRQQVDGGQQRWQSSPEAPASVRMSRLAKVEGCGAVGKREVVALFQPTGGATEKHPVQTVSPLDTHSIFGTVTSHLVGRAISKEFLLNDASKLFHGRVKSHDAKRGYFLIQYEDGDEEELPESEVRRHLFTPVGLLI